MTSQPKHFRIFISSPSDVKTEREIAMTIIEQLPYDPILRGKVTFEIIAWDKLGGGTPLLANVTPQQAINDGLPKPSECDIVVVIFWARMGTPLPYPSYQKPNGDPYLSGTEWEYEDAMNAVLQRGYPKLLVYRRTDKVMIDLNQPDFLAQYEQHQHVKRFFEKFHDPLTGAILQGYNQYEKPNDFQNDFAIHLRAIVRSLLGKS